MTEKYEKIKNGSINNQKKIMKQKTMAKKSKQNKNTKKISENQSKK